ncbi:hypothetical protein LCGC14_0429050 [marine sediment metagenome]|uniref:Uncharacterized protein n=1 Tax=marine sediment metagenome TaxID=412755 RepID=A0A0F9T6R4_9ZZZZ
MGCKPTDDAEATAGAVKDLEEMLASLNEVMMGTIEVVAGVKVSIASLEKRLKVFESEDAPKGDVQGPGFVSSFLFRYQLSLVDAVPMCNRLAYLDRVAGVCRDCEQKYGRKIKAYQAAFKAYKIVAVGEHETDLIEHETKLRALIEETKELRDELRGCEAKLEISEDRLRELQREEPKWTELTE